MLPVGFGLPAPAAWWSYTGAARYIATCAAGCENSGRCKEGGYLKADFMAIAVEYFVRKGEDGHHKCRQERGGHLYETPGVTHVFSFTREIRATSTGSRARRDHTMDNHSPSNTGDSRILFPPEKDTT
jgi:hypothetical protein